MPFQGATVPVESKSVVFRIGVLEPKETVEWVVAVVVVLWGKEFVKVVVPGFPGG